MRIPLTRIEYEYVFNTFTEVLPPLYLQVGTVFHTILSGKYVLKHNRIYFSAPFELINRDALVFFHHKKRSICFFAHIKMYNRSCYFSISDTAYKYDPDEEKRESIITNIVLPEKQSITAYEHEFFPLDSIIHEGLPVPHFPKELPSAYRIAFRYISRQDGTGNSLPLFLYRLYEFERKISAVFNPQEHKDIFVLFVDDKILICGCQERYTFSLENRQSLQFTLHFSRRSIKVSKGKTLFSHFLGNNSIVIFGFSFDDVFEEDRRFLYENVYHEKYNPAHLCKQD